MKLTTRLFLFLFCILGVLIYLGIHRSPSIAGTVAFISPLPGYSDSRPEESPIPSLAGNLGDVIEQSLADAPGRYAVVVKHLGTGENYWRNDRDVFQPASLYKLWVMATVMDQIRTGTLRMDDVITEDIANLNRIFDISPEYAEQSSGTFSMSVREALDQMITISHNYAALALSKKVGLSEIQDDIATLNMTDTSIGVPPLTTARDTALFFEHLYQGNIVSKDATLVMIDLLKNQQRNNKLPSQLPTDVSIAHKTGELYGFSHDAGIVYGKRGDYLIVILSESSNPLTANDHIAALSKAVYDYYEE